MKKILGLLICIQAHSGFIFGNSYEQECGLFNVGVEWLYWKVEETQLSLMAHDMFSVATDSTSIHAEAVYPNFKFSNGYCIWGDYLLQRCWTLGGALTHIASHPSVNISLDPATLITNNLVFNTPLYPIFEAFRGLTSAYSSFSMQWDLDLYYFDLYCQRSLCLCGCFVFDPYIAARGFWMKQGIDFGANSPGEGGGPVSIFGKFHEKFLGVGVAGGAHAAWELGCGFSLVGQFGGSLIYSRVKSSSDITGLATTSILRATTSDKKHKSHPSFDTFLGAQYVYNFCACGTQWYIGWDNHIFFEANSFSVSEDGKLTAQGLTLGGNLIF